jgi:hypothetical protein
MANACWRKSVGPGRPPLPKNTHTYFKDCRLAGSNSRERVLSMIQQLSSKNSVELQRATTESLVYLGILKRFAVKGQDLEN